MIDGLSLSRSEAGGRGATVGGAPRMTLRVVSSRSPFSAAETEEEFASSTAEARHSLWRAIASAAAEDVRPFERPADDLAAHDRVQLDGALDRTGGSIHRNEEVACGTREHVPPVGLRDGPFAGHDRDGLETHAALAVVANLEPRLACLG